jgi:hypothetical protein
LTDWISKIRVSDVTRMRGAPGFGPTSTRADLSLIATQGMFPELAATDRVAALGV